MKIRTAILLLVICFFLPSVLFGQIGSLIRHEGLFLRSSAYTLSDPSIVTSNGALIKLDRSYHGLNFSFGLNSMEWNNIGYGMGVSFSTHTVNDFAENLGAQTILYSDARTSAILFDPFFVLGISKRTALVVSGIAGWKFHSYEYQDTSSVSGSSSTYQGSTSKSVFQFGGGAGFWYALNKRIVVNLEYHLLTTAKTNPSSFQYQINNVHYYTTETTKEPGRFSGQFTAGLIFRFY